MAEYLSLDDIQDFGVKLPFGVEFNTRIINIEEKTIKDTYPVVVFTLEIQDGPFAKATVDKTYWVKITKSEKNGKLYSRGLSELKSDANTLGVLNKLPDKFEYPINLKAVKLAAHKAFAGLKFRVILEEQSYEKDGETKLKTQVNVLPGKTSAPASDATEEELVY